VVLRPKGKMAISGDKGIAKLVLGGQIHIKYSVKETKWAFHVTPLLRVAGGIWYTHIDISDFL
jgi:hypothetical protein